MNGTAPILSVANLTVAYGNTVALDNVCLDLMPGETLALVGESGSGKSTLGRAIVRLVSPQSGSIHFRGKDILGLRGRGLRAIRREVQMIFQDPFSSLDPRLRINDIVGEPFDIFGYGRAERNARVSELLELVGLRPDQRNRYPHEFSGGQRQRIGIARALALNPSVIVCDEPVSALDVSIQAQIINLLIDLQEKFGIAYLFISHDLGVVRFLADRIAIMHRGRIIERGNTEDVFREPREDYTRELLAASLGVPAESTAASVLPLRDDALKSIAFSHGHAS